MVSEIVCIFVCGHLSLWKDVSGYSSHYNVKDAVGLWDISSIDVVLCNCLDGLYIRKKRCRAVEETTL